jgi:phospholipase/carboxylesterase
MHIHTKEISTAGTDLEKAQNVLIMVHGRGATAPTILQLADHLDLTGFALQAPQAKQYSWYPYSFMAPQAQNEPGLSSGLQVLTDMVADLMAAGFSSKQIYFLGFSQGACLVSEFVARNATEYGAVFIYSGGLIGAQMSRDLHRGDLSGTPILMGCSDRDPHIPLERFEESAQVFAEMGAQVQKRLYPNGPHSVYPDEIERSNEILKIRTQSGN